MNEEGDADTDHVEDEHWAGEEAHADGVGGGQMMAAMMKMARMA